MAEHSFVDWSVMNCPLKDISEESEGQQWIKRVIGLPGEVLDIKDGRVYIDNVALSESYILEEPSYQFGPIQIPEDSYLVLGDNRNNSRDSHYWGVLPADNIVGRAIIRYWPLTRFGLLSEKLPNRDELDKI